MHRATGSGRCRSTTELPNVFRRENDHWLVAFDGQTTRVRNLKGLRYISVLLAHPGREFHACDLVAGGSRSSAETGTPLLWEGDTGPLLDEEAREVYRRRLLEIDEEIEIASELGDPDGLAQARFEREFLARELARAVGLGGRERRGGSAAERARVSVTQAIRRAIARLREHHPPLAEHLECFLRTGRYCVYRPDPRAQSTWRV